MVRTAECRGRASFCLVSALFLCAMFLSFPGAAHAQTVLFGDQTVESQPDSNPLGMAEAFQTTASTTGQITYINLYVDTTSSATSIYVGLYSDAGGTPGALLTQGTTASPKAGDWNAIPVTAVNVTAGTAYWIAILGTQSGTPVFRDNAEGVCVSETSSQTTLIALPNLWDTGYVYSTGSCPISAYGLTSAPS